MIAPPLSFAREGVDQLDDFLGFWLSSGLAFGVDQLAIHGELVLTSATCG